MHPVWTIVSILIALTAIFTIVDLIRGHRSSLWATVGWVALIVILPLIGSLIYWVTRKPTADDAERAYEAEAELQRSRAHSSFDHTGNPM